MSCLGGGEGVHSEGNREFDDKNWEEALKALLQHLKSGKSAGLKGAAVDFPKKAFEIIVNQMILEIIN